MKKIFSKNISLLIMIFVCILMLILGAAFVFYSQRKPVAETLPLEVSYEENEQNSLISQNASNQINLPGYDLNHSVYMAVYYVDENFNTRTFNAPTTYSQGAELDEQKLYNCTTTCEMSYAGNKFYIYGEGAITRYVEYYVEHGVMKHYYDSPVCQVLSTTGGYEYIGYTYQKIQNNKLSSSATLARAKSAKEIDNTTIKTSTPKNAFPDFTCEVFSFYFYKPSSITFKTSDVDLGRISESESTAFNKCVDNIVLNDLQRGYKIEYSTPAKNDTERFVTISGQKSIVFDGRRNTHQFSKTIYFKSNTGCFVSDLGKQEYSTTKSGENLVIEGYFTQELVSLSVNIVSSISTSDDVQITVYFGRSHKTVTLAAGENVTTNIVLENIPKNTEDILSFGWKVPQEDRYFYLSDSPDVEHSHSCIKYFGSKFASDYMTLSEDTVISAPLSYLFECYKITFIKQTPWGEYSSITYAMINVPTSVSISIPPKEDDFLLIGYTQDPTSHEPISSIETNHNYTLYSIWERTLTAKFYNQTSAYNFVKVTHKVYNFNQTTSFTVDNFPAGANLIGYTTNNQSFDVDEQLMTSKVVENGQNYYGVFNVPCSVTYAAGIYGAGQEKEDQNVINALPQNEFVYVRKVSGGVQDEATFVIADMTYSPEFYEFDYWVDQWNFRRNALDKYDALNINYTLTPKYKEKIYSVTLDLCGGKISGLEITSFETTHFTSVKFNEPTRFGYTLKCISSSDSNVVIYYNMYSKRYEISNISQNTHLQVDWDYAPLTTNLRLYSWVPSDFNVEIAVTYSFTHSKNTYSGETTISRTHYSHPLTIYMDGTLEISATITEEDYCVMLTSSTTYTPNQHDQSSTIISNGTYRTTTYIYLTKLYEVTLHENTGDNNTITLYKAHDQALNVKYHQFPNSTLGQKSWNTAPDGSAEEYGEQIAQGQNSELSLYAIWGKCVKYYTESAQDVAWVDFLEVGSTYRLPTLSGMHLPFEAWSRNPNALPTNYSYIDMTFTDTVSWYAVYKKYNITETSTKNIVINFYNKNGELLLSDSGKVTTTVAGDPAYVNVDGTAYKMASTRIIEQIGVTTFLPKLEDFGEYSFWGWSTNANNLQNIIKSESYEFFDSVNLYPVWTKPEDNFNYTQIKHTFKVKYGSDASCFSQTKQQSNTVKVYSYNLSKTAYDSVSEIYEIVCLPMEYFNYNSSTITVVGWTRNPASCEAEWLPSNSFTPNGATTFYAVTQRLVTKTTETTLFHKLYVDSDKYISLSTTKTTTWNNVPQNYSYDLTSITQVGTGVVNKNTYSKLTFPTAQRDDVELYGWSRFDNTISACRMIGEQLSMTEDTTYYAVWINKINFEINYSVETGEQIEKTTGEDHVWHNYDFSQIFAYAKSLTITSIVPQSQYGFLSWLDTNFSSENEYLPQSYYIFETDKFDYNLKELSVTLFAKLVEPPVINISFQIDQNSTCEQTFISGTEIVLPELEDMHEKEFVGWQVGEEIYNAGTRLLLTENKTIVALYKKLSSETWQGDESQTDNNNEQGENEILGGEQADESKLPTGAIIGISIAASFAVLCAAGVTVLFMLKKKKSLKNK